MNESEWSEYVGRRIRALPMCAGKREALMDELRYAAQVADHAVRVERHVRAALGRARAILARGARRVADSAAQHSLRSRQAQK